MGRFKTDQERAELNVKKKLKETNVNMSKIQFSSPLKKFKNQTIMPKRSRIGLKTG